MPGRPAPSGTDNFEGIEEASSGLTDLSGTCTDFTDGVVTIALAADDIAMFAADGDGNLVVNGFPLDCDDDGDAATTTTVKRLLINGSSGDETVIIDHSGGTFSQGLVGSSFDGGGITVDLGGGSGDKLGLRGSASADTYLFGLDGITWNSDSYRDVSFTAVEEFTITMGAGDDSFTGAGSAATGSSAFADPLTVYGGAGADTIRGGDGIDTFFGGDGNDTFNAGTTAAPDELADEMNGGDGTDTADYSGRTTALTLTIDGTANDGPDNDDIEIDVENVIGGSNGDTITGSPSANTLSGGGGADTLAGGGGADTLNGDAGNDTFNAAADTGGDIMNGGDGVDHVNYTARTAAITVTIDSSANDGESNELDRVSTDVENVTGASGAFVNTLTGSASDNVLIGGAGIDTLSGGAGNDTLSGLALGDTLNGDAGNDTILGGTGNDTLNGGSGNDTFDEAAAANGNDTMNGGTGVDLVDYEDRTETLEITMDGTTATGDTGNAEADLVGTDVENVRGSSTESNTIVGNALDNTITGGVDVDDIDGLAGDDVIDGLAEDDVITCGAGDGDILLDNTLDATTDALAEHLCELW